MLANVNIHSSVAVYVQIENHVRFAIASGQLKAGDQLPSVRELSERLNLNPNTVAKAYRDLEVMGYLYTRRGMGVFINKGIEGRCREDCRKTIIGRLYEVIAEAKASGITPLELKDVMHKCVTMDSAPYSEVPAIILAPAKHKSTAQK